MVRDFKVAALIKMLCKRVILLALFVVCINSAWAQEPAWNRVVTICADSYFIANDGSPSGNGTWSVHNGIGSGTFGSTTQATTVTNISVEENWYRWNLGGHNYYIKVIRVIAPVYTLTAPETFCEGDEELILRLSGSHTDYTYFLELNGAILPGSEEQGTGSTIEWTVTQTGSYRAVAIMNLPESNCEIPMDGIVNAVLEPLPAVYDLEAPAGTDFCSGTTVPLRLSGSDSGILYQLYQGTSPAEHIGLAQSGTGSPLTWNVKLDGSYHVVATNSAGCQETMNGEVILNELPLPLTFTLSSQNPAFCQGSGDQATLILDGSESGVTYQLTRGGTPVAGTEQTSSTGPLQWATGTAGTYRVIALDGICQSLMNGSVTVTQINKFSLSSSKSYYCQGENGVTLTLSGSQSGVNYRVFRNINNPIGTWAGTGKEIEWPNMTAGDYEVIAIKDGVPCLMGSLTVEMKSFPGGLVDPVAPICLGESAQLNASGGDSYLWQPSATLNNHQIADPLATPTVSTTYSVTITDGFGCSVTEDVEVVVHPLPGAYAGSDKTICRGESVLLNNVVQVPGYQYSWSPLDGSLSDPAISNPVAQPDETTTYKLTVTTQHGCSSIDQVTVNVNPAPMVNAEATSYEICAGGSVELSVTGTAGIDYLWSTGEITENITVTPLNTSTYHVTGTNPVTGCATTDNATINVNLLPQIFAIEGGGEFCEGADGVAVGLTGSETGVIYELLRNGASTGQTESGTGSPVSFGKQNHDGTNTYTVLARNAASLCSILMPGSAIITKNRLPAPAQSVTGPSSTCPDTPVTLFVPEIARADNYVWSLPPETTITGGETTNTINVMFPRDAGIVTISVKGENDCGTGPASPMKEITVRPLPGAAGPVTGITELCEGDMNISYSTPTVNHATSYLWELPPGASITGFVNSDTERRIIVAFSKGSSSGYVRVTPSNNCGTGEPSELLVTVNAIPGLVINDPSGELDCSGDPVTLSATSSTPVVAWAWTAHGGGRITGDANIHNPQVDMPGTYRVTATANGCSAKGEISLARNTAAPEGIIISKPAGMITCNTQEMTLTASTSSTYPVTYQWQASEGGNILSVPAPDKVTINRGGHYTVIATNVETSCTSDPVSIFIQEDTDSPDLSAMQILVSGNISCINDNVVLSTDPALPGTFAHFEWTSATGIIDNTGSSAPTVYSAGIYTLKVTGGNGCTAEKPVEVINDQRVPDIWVNQNPGTINCTDTQVQLQGSTTVTGASLLWTGPGIVSGSTITAPWVNEPGVYKLTITHPESGCPAEASVNVIEDIAVPSVFFPDAPGDITCSNLSVTVGSGTDASDPKYQWFSPQGQLMSQTGPALTVTTGGTYTLRITDQNNHCTGEESIGINENKTVPGVSIAVPGTLTCTLTSVTLMGSSPTADVAWSWSTADGTISSGGNTATPSVTAAGSYTATATHPVNGCISQAVVQVTENKSAPVIVNFNNNPQSLTCSRQQVQLSGNAADASLLWTGPSGAQISNPQSPNPFVNAPGTYTLTATGNSNGCPATRNVTVVQVTDTPAGLEILPFDNLSCSNNTTILRAASSTPGTTFRWEEGPGGTILGDPLHETISVEAAATYTVYAAHPQTGCEISAQAQVTLLSAAPAITFAAGLPPEITCNNQSDGIRLSATVEPAGSDLLWTGPGSIENDDDTEPTVYLPGTYTLTAWHPVTGCSTSSDIVVGSNLEDPRIISFNVPGPVTCENQTIEITPELSAGTFSYQWTAGSGGQISGSTENKRVIVSSGGTYNLTVTDQDNGCTAQGSVFVAENKTVPHIAVNTSPAPLSCVNIRTPLYGTSTTTGALYQWDGPGNIENPTTEHPLVDQQGEYMLTVTDPLNGCKASATVTVGENKIPPQQPQIIAPQELTCDKLWTDLKVSPLPDNVDYLWTTTSGGTILYGETPTASVNQPGTYLVTVTDRANGCTNFNSIEVTRNSDVAAVEITGGPYLLSCATVSLGLAGSSALGIDPAWTTVGGNIISDRYQMNVTVNAPGEYFLTVHHPVTGCPSTASVTVGQTGDIPLIDIDNFPGSLTCQASSVELYGRPVDGSHLFEWSTAGGNIWSGEDSYNPVVDAPGTYVITVTNPLTGCTNQASVTVEEDTTTATFTIAEPDQFTCLAGEVQLRSTITSGTSDVEWLWTTVAGGTIRPGDENVQNPVVTSPGVYTLRVIKNSNSCWSEKQVTVTGNMELPHISADKNPPKLTCDRIQVILSAGSNTAGATFMWTSDDNHPIVNYNSSQPRVSFPGWYTVTATHPATGCTDFRRVEVIQDIQPPHIHIEPGNLTLTCSTTSVRLEGNSTTANVSYRWIGPGSIPVADTRTVYVSDPGTYTLEVTRVSTGCTATLPVTVGSDTEPASQPAADDIFVCFGAAPGTLEATGSNIRWYDNSSLHPDNLIHSGSSYTPDQTAPGSYYYYATQTGTNGCESPFNQVAYTVRDLPQSPSGTGGEICQGSPNPQLTADGSNIRWYDSPTGTLLATGPAYTPDALVSAPGTYDYYISQTDAYGCESELSQVSLVIRPVPAPPAISQTPLEACHGEQNPAFAATGSNIKWYGSNSSFIPLYSGNEFTPAASVAGAHHYYVSQTNSHGCESERAQVTLIINEIPVKYDVTGGGIFCENANGVSVGLSGSTTAIEYTLWLDGSIIAGNATGTGDLIDFGLITAPGIYTVTAASPNGCQSVMHGSVTLAVTSLPAAPGPVSGALSVCQGSTNVPFSIPAVTGATHYIWELPPGAVVAGGANTRSIVVDFHPGAQSGAIRVRGANGCGEGPVSGDHYVSVDNLPENAGQIMATASNSQVCRGQEEVIFEVPAIANATAYLWQIPAGASIVQGEGSRSIKVKFSPEAAQGDQVVRVRAENSCGTGGWSDDHILTVFAPPVIYAGDDQQLCTDQSALSGSPVPAGGTAIWETVSGYAVFSDRNASDPLVSSLAMGENVFAYNVTLDACFISDTVRVNNNRVLVNAGSNRVICNEEINLAGSQPPAGSSGLWSVAGGGASFENAGYHLTSARNFNQGDNELYWTITKNGCISRASVIITNHRPQGINAGGDISTCNGEAFLNASSPAAGVGDWKIISGQGAFDDSSDPVTRVYNLDKGINRIAWVVDNYACSIGDTITVNNREIDITAGADQVLCDSRTTLNATVPPEGATGEWSVIRGAATFMERSEHDTRVSGLATGENEVMWTIIKSGCVFTDNVILVNNMPTPANAGPDQEISINHAQLEANEPMIGTGLWSVMNGSAAFSNTALHDATVTDLAPGPNVLRWTITNQGCSSASDVTINNGALESIYAGEDQTLCGNETRLNASEPPFGFGIWTLRQGSARFENNEQADTRVYDLGQGVNVLRWSVTIGSTEYFDEVTIINNTPSAASAGSNRALCSDSYTLAGNQPVIGSGIWTIEGGSAQIANNTLYNSQVSGLAQGNNIFRWTVSHENCVSSNTVIITNDIPTTPDAGPGQSTCDGTAELFPNTPTIGNGEWSVLSGAGSFEGNFVSSLANGENILQYTITRNQCKLSDQVTITNYRPTTADAGYNMNVCENSAELNANQPNIAVGETGQWTVINGSGIFDDPLSANTMVRGLAQGKNVFRWTIGNQGCVSYDEIVVSFDFIQADAGRDVITCDNELILNANNPGNGAGQWSVRGGSGSATFESPNSSNTRVTNLDRGNNVLRWTVTNNRCVSWDEITVRNDSPSNAYAGADQSLCTDNIQLQARQPVIGSGRWSVVNGSGEFANEHMHNTMVNSIRTGSNTYRWTVENEGCISVDEVVIRNNQPFDTFAGADQVLCEDSALLSASLPEEGQGTWSIIKGAGVIDNAYNNTTPVSGLAPGENILRWTVTNGQCSAYSEVILQNNKPTIAAAGADRTICEDNTTLEGNIPVQGSGTWSVISGSGSFTDAGLYNSGVEGLSRGNNILRWTITRENCISTSDVVIRNDRPTIPDAGVNIAVCGNSTPLNGNMPAVGTGRWGLVSGTGSFDDPSRYNTTIRELGQGTNILQWTITNNSCSLSDRVEVRNNRTDVYAGPDQIVYTSQAYLSANIPARGTGIWNTDAGGGTIASPGSHETSVEGLHEGVNTFIWSVNIDGCISSDDVRITYYRQPTASFTVSQTEGCPPLQVRFTKTTTEDYPYRWELGEDGITILEENPVYTYEKPGRYFTRLYVTGPDGQDVVSERIITVHEPPVSTFELAPTRLFIPEGELRTFNYSTNSSQYLWDFGDGNSSDEFSPVHTYQNEGSFLVRLAVWSAEGCYDLSEYRETVSVTKTTRINFPSAFTPNPAGSGGGRYNRHDFSNHVFYPIILNGNIDNYKLEIYNRWGVLLFESNDIDVGWDGYYREQPASEDVYIYRVTGVLNSGEKIRETGDFLLMRRD